MEQERQYRSGLQLSKPGYAHDLWYLSCSQLEMSEPIM